jgi:uncharacterized protein YbaA (DUF1428 family)
MTYIHGFVLAVPTAHQDAYRAHARAAAEVFEEYGATSAVETWGDDVPHGEVTDFYRAVRATVNETVVFGWMTWPSLQALQAGMEGALADARLSPECLPMPFDGQRAIFGGFTPLLELGAPQAGGYFDGYLAPVPSAGREAFAEFAAFCDAIFMEFGATWIVESWGEWLPPGTVNDMRGAVDAQPEENVLFSWVQWPDKATRDAASARMMEDERFASLEMPFDGRRLVYGGFVPLLQRSARAT